MGRNSKFALQGVSKSTEVSSAARGRRPKQELSVNGARGSGSPVPSEVGLECGRCSLVWNVNEQSSGPRFRSGRWKTAEDRRRVARVTTDGYVVHVVPRSPLKRGTVRAVPPIYVSPIF